MQCVANEAVVELVSNIVYTKWRDLWFNWVILDCKIWVYLMMTLYGMYVQIVFDVERIAYKYTQKNDT